MSKNIKEIGKELLGKSLNSFHRKTGLTQLEKNNEMQDGILDGILSQVDDAYIEKTEQSNIIHLDGSGDGVVVLDSIEGNTVDNLCPPMNEFRHGQVEVLSKTSIKIKQTSVGNVQLLKNPITDMKFKPNTLYTVYAYIKENTIDNDIQLIHSYMEVFVSKNIVPIGRKQTGLIKGTFVTKDDLSNKNFCMQIPPNSDVQGYVIIENMIIVEGDKTNEEVNYFEGLQSSFEEKANEQGKYEIEILSHKGRPNELKNSFKELQASPREYMSISITDIARKYLGKRLVVSGKLKTIGKNGDVRIYSLGKYSVGFSTLFNCNTSNYINFVCEGRFTYEPNGANGEACNLSFYGIYDSGIFPCVKDIKIEILDDNDNILATEWCPSYKDDEIHWKNHKNSNKIKLLLNEPLRAIDDTKDRLCVKDNILVAERNTLEVNLTSDKNYIHYSYQQVYLDPIIPFSYSVNELLKNDIQKVICDKLPYDRSAIHHRNVVGIASFRNDSQGYNAIRFGIHKNTLGITGSLSNISYTNELKAYLTDNPMKVIVQLEEPYYEEVLNEYGEPIILEGYENGTLYIDSTVIPTTTVRYTPKMESFKTLKEVNKNNNLITLDINENIIPYMMDVDYMIMEKELCLLNTKNIRKMEELDMTSMQKRTQDMLERLIKGKTLTEQECKTRVTTYLNAGKITDEQAEELMLVISEVYA